jgi:hypothetical protein
LARNAPKVLLEGANRGGKVKRRIETQDCDIVWWNGGLDPFRSGPVEFSPKAYVEPQNGSDPAAS